MQKIVFILALSLFSFVASAQTRDSLRTTPDPAMKLQTVEASCGQCQFGLTGKKGCDLAVRIEGKSYFVDNTKIDDHGDAHAKDGFCETIRKANVQGTIVDNRFKATYFKLVKPAKETE